MLYYVGKDLLRWIDQSMEFAASNASLCPRVSSGRASRALVQDAPPTVEAKLRNGAWRTTVIFARAIGLNCMFAEAPPINVLAGEFVRNYFRYADQLFASYQSQTSFTRLTASDFQFELYSSGEYRACSNASDGLVARADLRSALWRPHFAWRVRAHCDSVGQRLDIGCLF